MRDDAALLAKDPLDLPSIGKDNAVQKPLNDNYYGLQTHFRVDEDLRDMVNRYDLYVENVASYSQEFGAGRFRVASRHGPQALEKLIGSFAEVDEDGFVELDRKTLKSFLRFLRQPILQTLGEQNRRLGHNVTRFLTTGHVEIPLWVNKTLEDATSLECHLKGQRNMEEIGLWKKKAELWKEPEKPGIWRKRSEEWTQEDEKRIVASVPGTGYNPEQGFTFDVAENLRSGGGFKNPNQQALQEAVWEAVNEATNGRYLNRNTNKIALDANELRRFYRHAITADIPQIIARAEIEERAEADLTEILETTENLANNPRFQIAQATYTNSLTAEDRLSNAALTASSFLTPIMSQQTTRDVRRKSQIIEHWLGLSDPIGNISKESAVLGIVLEKLDEAGIKSDAAAQAVATKYRKLYNFAHDLAVSSEEATDHKKLEKYRKTPQTEAFIESMRKQATALQSASVTGIGIADLNGSYAELLDAVGNALDQNGNVIAHQAKGTWDMMVGFWQGVGESAEDNAYVAAGLTGLIGYAYMMRYGFDTQGPIAPPTNAPTWGDSAAVSTIISQDYITAFADQAREARAAVPDYDPCLEKMDFSCHLDPFLPRIITDGINAVAGKDLNEWYPALRHYIGIDLIAGATKSLQATHPQMVAAGLQNFEDAVQTMNVNLNWDINPDHTTYMAVSEPTADFLGGISIDANTLQDGSHTSMIWFGAQSGAVFGFAAYSGMAGLSAEFLNPLYRMGSGTGNFAVRGAAKATQLAAVYGVSQIHHESTVRLHEKASQTHDWADPKHHEKFILAAIDSTDGLNELVVNEKTGAITSATSEIFDPINIPIGVGWYGLKKEQITINRNNISDVRKALNRLALNLEYSADDIDIESEAFIAELQRRLSSIEKAIQEYAIENNAINHCALKAKLQESLSMVMGTEFKWTGESEIYRSIFPEPEPGHDTTNKSAPARFRRFFTEPESVKDERRLHVVKRLASMREGRILNAERRQEKAEQSCNAKNPLQPSPEITWNGTQQNIKYGLAGLNTVLHKAHSRTFQGANWLKDKFIITARLGVQEPFNQAKHKGKWVVGGLSASFGGLVADVLGYSNPVVDTLSGAGAVVTTTVTSGIIVVGANTPQDLALHSVIIAGGVSLSAVFLHYGGKKVIKPALQGLAEAARNLDKLTNLNSPRAEM